jgi:16S rRNA (uracil1498-N3)-methyltransferase
MSHVRIYCPSTLTVGDDVQLPPQAAHHVAKVLRLTAGDVLTLFNNQGGEYTARISQITKQKVSAHVQTHEAIEREARIPVHLGQVISKGDRFDWLLQKATELGVARITPLFSQRCNVKLDDQRLAKRHAHWQGVIISACEQCGRNRLPQLMPAIALTQWVQQTESALKFVLHPTPDRTRLNPDEPPEAVRLLVGPEGGLTEDEVALAGQHHYRLLGLGPRILRTETAGVTALAWCQYVWG